MMSWGESLLEIMAAHTQKKHLSMLGKHSKLSLRDIENADGKVCLVWGKKTIFDRNPMLLLLIFPFGTCYQSNL
jgi:hypothetical protein